MRSITTKSYPTSIQCAAHRARKSTEEICMLAVTAGLLVCPSAVHGQNATAAGLRVPTFALPENPQIAAPRSRELSTITLSNGTEIKSRLRLDGSGELAIKNGTPYDAIVNVVEPLTHRVVRSFYVQSGKNFVEKNLAPDAYDVYFSTGKDWDSKSRLFQADAYYGRLEREIAFSERLDPATGKTEFRGYEVTLQAVAGGDSVFLPVDPATFQALMNQPSDSAQLEQHPASKNQPNAN
jgi:hypothetical protein